VKAHASAQFEAPRVRPDQGPCGGEGGAKCQVGAGQGKAFVDLCQTVRGGGVVGRGVPGRCACRAGPAHHGLGLRGRRDHRRGEGRQDTQGCPGASQGLAGEACTPEQTWKLTAALISCHRPVEGGMEFFHGCTPVQVCRDLPNGAVPGGSSETGMAGTPAVGPAQKQHSRNSLRRVIRYNGLKKPWSDQNCHIRTARFPASRGPIVSKRTRFSVTEDRRSGVLCCSSTFPDVTEERAYPGHRALVRQAAARNLIPH